MIITIARQCGCMGDEIGQRLADEYGLTFYNKEHIVKLAKEKGYMINSLISSPRYR